jgi:hypothetical protein
LLITVDAPETQIPFVCRVLKRYNDPVGRVRIVFFVCGLDPLFEVSRSRQEARVVEHQARELEYSFANLLFDRQHNPMALPRPPEIATAFAFLASSRASGASLASLASQRGTHRTAHSHSREDDQTAFETAFLRADTWNKRALIVHSFICDLERRGIEFLGHLAFHASSFGRPSQSRPQAHSDSEHRSQSRRHSPSPSRGEVTLSFVEQKSPSRAKDNTEQLQLFDLPLTANDFCSCLLIER